MPLHLAKQRFLYVTPLNPQTVLTLNLKSSLSQSSKQSFYDLIVEKAINRQANSIPENFILFNLLGCFLKE